MPTQYIPRAGGTIDPSAAAAARVVDWAGVTLPTAVVVIANAGASVAYLVTSAVATASGRSIAPGASASFGPYAPGAALWVVGSGVGPAHYSFDGVFNEGSS